MISVYLAFALAALGIFWRMPVRPAILIVFFGGWVLLPVAAYPPVDPTVSFPWWITGTALPGDMLVSKIWIVPVVALTGGLLSDPRAILRLRPSWLDVPISLWCLWPLSGLWLQVAAVPAPATAALYLFGVWGAVWLLGRIWFSDPGGQILLLKGCAFSGLACLPFALAEGFCQISLYQMAYGPHPYAADGLHRYVGCRPVGFFEHGNQYGLWVSAAALAALWLAFFTKRSIRTAPIALATAAVAVAAQSVGALALCAAGICAMALWRLRIVWPLMVFGLVATTLVLGLHLSGLVPIRWIARETEIGQFILSTFRELGRGSFTWRISQDLKTIPLIEGAWLSGTMIWDWWRPAGIRPWGLWLLMIGQFGVVGFVLVYATLSAIAMRSLTALRGLYPTGAAAPAMPLALIVLIALADSMLNAFFYFPALLAAGAITRATPLAIDRPASPVTPSA